jgi:phosphonoacetaldehyde hydrolase
MTIRLAIFDLGGTIVDKYSLSPFISLKQAFKRKRINVNNHLIYKDMGMNKKEHIGEILNDKYIRRIWFKLYGEYPNSSSAMSVYDEFIKYQMDEGISNIEILPETKSCIKWLGDNNISIGATTGFSKPIMSAIKEKLIDEDIHIHKYVSSTCLGKPGRPNPHMMNEIINSLSIADRKRVIKIDDTCVGIEEGKNAGTLTVGVAKWSTNMKMTEYNQDENMSKEEYVERLKSSREALWKANPDYVIDSLDELPRIIKHINNESEI